MEDYLYDINYWDNLYFTHGVLVVRGLAIINEWVKLEDAIEITYSFN